MTAELNIDKFEDFIAQYPIFEYRILNTGDLSVEERVRIVCQQECERYGSTWACPPAAAREARAVLRRPRKWRTPCRRSSCPPPR